MKGARILVAPLDWGLGHAARCVPVVSALLHRGAVPVIAADNGPLALLRTEFPELEHVRLPGITIRYSKSGSQLVRMALQFPAMVRQVQAEQRAFERLRGSLRIDAVISDQRFGVRAADLPSVLITHQVFPFTPVAQGALRKVNLRHIERFHCCWVMDEPQAPGLAGELSHVADARSAMPVNARYVGALSRLRPVSCAAHDVVAVISGPEPQRTLFERELISVLRVLPGKHVLVRGLPHMAQEAGEEHIGNVRVMAHADADTLQGLLTGARAIVSRSGYTTLMDLAALGRSAIVVPTPGQEEQEYLGRLHTRTGRFVVQQQGHLDLSASVLERASGSRAVASQGDLLQQALDELHALLR
ncbi:MAG: glycosyl transferase family 28 [Flavobacteriales bacterium]|nr:MAG: glycosyl transferase family 28 [Flavobacteriales bacterium]